MNRVRLLLLAAGTRSARNILATLAGRRENVVVVGATSVANEPGPFECDTVHLVPETASPDFEAALRHNARVTCASAAGDYGLWLREPPAQHHLACNHGHGAGFVRHRTVRFDGHPTLPLAAVEDVVLHAMSCLAPPASTAIATSAIGVLSCGFSVASVSPFSASTNSPPMNSWWRIGVRSPAAWATSETVTLAPLGAARPSPRGGASAFGTAVRHS